METPFEYAPWQPGKGSPRCFGIMSAAGRLALGRHQDATHSHKSHKLCEEPSPVCQLFFLTTHSSISTSCWLGVLDYSAYPSWYSLPRSCRTASGPSSSISMPVIHLPREYDPSEPCSQIQDTMSDGISTNYHQKMPMVFCHD
jgi:hypothetical protein